MNVLLLLAFLFYVGSIVGYLLEVIFRRFFCKEKQWINPGFLVGPYEPLYGFGLIILFLINMIDFTFVGNETLSILFEIVLMAIGVTVLEYVTGLIFVKGLKIKLWDYSDRWGNVQGIICPVYSFLWTAVCIIYYFFISPQIMSALSWFTNNLTFSFFIGFFFGILFIDLCYTCHVVHKIRKFAKEHDIVVRYNNLKESINEFNKKQKERLGRIFPFGTNLTRFREKLDYYKDAVSKKMGLKGKKYNTQDSESVDETETQVDSEE